MTLNRVAIPSPCYSSGRSADCRLIVIHTAEGASTYQSLGSWFGNPANGVSSHAGIDDTPGTIGVFVRRIDVAWTQANANSVAVSAELCAFASWDIATWHNHPAMLENLAAWIAEEADAFGIPIVALTPAEAQGGAAGVCQHIDLGSWGGGHVDCGPGFPMGEVLAMAGGAPTPAPPPGAAAPPAAQGPPWPGIMLVNFTEDPAVTTWQTQMSTRGWSLWIDGQYGDQSEAVCVAFQQEKGLQVDGVVGPETWEAAWSAPIT